MKKTSLIILISILIIGSATGKRGWLTKHASFVKQNSYAIMEEQQKKDTTLKVVYTCSMHPEIVQEKSGKCPKCGMNLTQKEIKKDVYTCSMHAEVKKDKPGKCPKCGMNLTLSQPAKKTE
jgi:uncharacterized protein with PIN domain